MQCKISFYRNWQSVKLFWHVDEATYNLLLVIVNVRISSVSFFMIEGLKSKGLKKLSVRPLDIRPLNQKKLKSKRSTCKG